MTGLDDMLAKEEVRESPTALETPPSIPLLSIRLFNELIEIQFESDFSPFPESIPAEETVSTSDFLPS